MSAAPAIEEPVNGAEQNMMASHTPGASLADLITRMGHASTRTAMIYQHTTRSSDEHIADGLSLQITAGKDRARNGYDQ
jgi:hypothetical protein